MSGVVESADHEGLNESNEVSAPPAQSVDDAYRSSLADGSASVGQAEKAKVEADATPVDSWEELDTDDFDLRVGGVCLSCLLFVFLS